MESWIQTGSIISCIGATGYIIWKQLHEYRKEMREDIKIQSQRADDLYIRLSNSAERTDKLYEMFIDLVKEGRK
jgi:hypothetical protein